MPKIPSTTGKKHVTNYCETPTLHKDGTSQPFIPFTPTSAWQASEVSSPQTAQYTPTKEFFGTNKMLLQRPYSRHASQPTSWSALPDKSPSQSVYGITSTNTYMSANSPNSGLVSSKTPLSQREEESSQMTSNNRKRTNNPRRKL